VNADERINSAMATRNWPLVFLNFKGDKMKCNCVHANVCHHRIAIDNAIHPILEIVYGPGNIANQVDLERAIEKVCRFKKEKKEEFYYDQALESLKHCFFDGEAWVVNEPPKEPPND
jgi:hypothetical protein